MVGYDYSVDYPLCVLVVGGGGVAAGPLGNNEWM